MGPRQSAVNQQKALIQQLENEKRDQAYAQKALVAERNSEGIIVDPMTQGAYKETTVVLDVSTWTTTVNTATTWTQIARTIVPNGIIYYFRQVKTDVDRNSPYLYGGINKAGPAAIAGTVKIQVWDASQTELKGQPFYGTTTDLAAAATAATNWYTRLFFNSRVPVRAQDGDIVTVSLYSAEVMAWNVSSLYLYLIQMTRQY
jgi:hypothetical protein